MDQSNRLLKLGLIGVSDEWESTYLPILKKSKQRIEIVSVFGRPHSRIRRCAKELGAQQAANIGRLLKTPGIDGILALDSGWFGSAPLWQCGRQAVSVLWACGLPQDSSTNLKRLGELTQQNHAMIFPDFRWRYWPATIRLMELLATKFGKPRQLTVGLPFDDAVDLVKYLTKFQTFTPAEKVVENEQGVETIIDARNVAGDDIEIDFRPSEIPLMIECEFGQASIKNRETILWTTQDEKHHEVLDQERSSEEIMIDHFCRRLVGGLIPVPGMDDLIATRKLSEQIRGIE